MRVKMSKPPPPAPTASAIGPCRTVIKIVGRPGTPRIKALRKQGTEDGGINTQYDLHYELLLMSVPRGWGGGREV